LKIEAFLPLQKILFKIKYTVLLINTAVLRI